MRLACLEFTIRGSSSKNVGVLRRGSLSGFSRRGFFLLIPMQYTTAAVRTQVLSHLWVRFIFLPRPLPSAQGWRGGVGQSAGARSSQSQGDTQVAPRSQ